jgi:polysaccharide deacetylase family protein (PEP-CTERM system associated)
LGIPAHKRILLFGIDLEDVRSGVVNGARYKERVPENTHTYLKWLNDNNSKCTFFVVGKVAELYPSLIDEIAQEGHEIACHTFEHRILSGYSTVGFHEDLKKNIEVLLGSGAREVKGFRAPSYSLTDRTRWVYPILAQLGIKYSSSVLPARNPLYNGWPGHSHSPGITDSGIIEIPLTTARIGPLIVPVLGGIYFRTLPEFVIKTLIGFRKSNPDPLIGYFHPYDIDIEQEKFMHGGINNNRIFNWLMYYNRGSVFSKLNFLLGAGYKIDTYNNFIKSAIIG